MPHKSHQSKENLKISQVKANIHINLGLITLASMGLHNRTNKGKVERKASNTK